MIPDISTPSFLTLPYSYKITILYDDEKKLSIQSVREKVSFSISFCTLIMTNRVKESY